MNIIMIFIDQGLKYDYELINHSNYSKIKTKN